MISKLPRWVEYGSFLLALVAGLVNSIGLLGFKQQSISHLSGTVTLLGTGIVSSTFTDVFHLLIILLSFLVGASISGYFLRNGTLRLGGNYSNPLSLEAIFLIASIYFLTRDSLYGHYLFLAVSWVRTVLVFLNSGHYLYPQVSV